MSEPWHITLLGSLRVQRGDQVITRFRYQKSAGLLAYLAYHLRQAHPREVLLDIFWPESEPDAGRASLSTVLSSLRNQLEPPGTPASAVLRADRFSISLHPAAVITDVGEFEDAIRAASRANSRTEQVQSLTRALERYQARLLPGFYEEWIPPEQERLAALFFDAASTLIGLLEEGGDLQSALGYARHAVRAEPLREEAHERLMRLLVAIGQPGAALRQYKEWERLLEEQLGREPSASLRVLARQIEKQSGLSAPSLPGPVVVPARPLGSVPLGLPSGMPTTANLLLTDIEGSARLGEGIEAAFQAAQETCHRLLRQAFARHGGQEIQEAGGSFVILFPNPHSALVCAVSIQQALYEQEWPEATGPIRVRIALHTGDVEFSEGAYHGPALHRGSHLLTAGAWGQILVSEATAGLLRKDLEESVRLVDLGVWRLRDVPMPERLYQAEYAGMPVEGFGPLAAEAEYPSRLPTRFTRFFGREQEIAQLTDLLLASEGRLLTLTGTGGTGKTRLAVEVADRVSERYGGVVWFVPLADLSDPALIASAICEALRLPASPQEPLEQVIEALAQQPGLLVLDNFEHLLPGESGTETDGASLVQALLERIPTLTCLVTSRQVLGLSAEREFPVGPLPTPNGPDTPERLSLYDSVRLFVDRAQAVRPDFQVSSYNAPAVAELCERLEGIPLAIELAAARAQVMTPFQLLSQLSDRFGLLTSRRRDVSERQRTLRGALDWSYRLLAPEVQRFFARLSVFRGSWSVEAAEAVCEEPLALDYLALLREGSLALTDDSGPAMRFRMLETIREYAAEQLTAAECVVQQGRHLFFFLALAEEAEANLQGPEQAAWFDRLDTEHDNLRAALRFSLGEAAEDGAMAGLRLAGALMRFWEVRGHLSEGRRHLAEALERGRSIGRTQERANVLRGAGLLAHHQGDFIQARSLHEESLAIFRELGNRQGIAASLNNLGMVAENQGDYARARALYEESLAIKREMGRDRQGIAASLNNLGNVTSTQGDYAAARAMYEEALAINREIGNRAWEAINLMNLGCDADDQGDYVSARRFLEESLAIRRELGDKIGIADSLLNLGVVAERQGDYARARTLYEEGLAIYQELGDRGGIADTLGSLGNVAYRQGDYAAARAYHEESLSIKKEIDDRAGMAVSLEDIADLIASQGQATRAARLWGAAETLRQAIGTPVAPNAREEYDRHVAAAQQALGEEGFAVEWEAGRAMALEEAVTYALEADSE